MNGYVTLLEAFGGGKNGHRDADLEDFACCGCWDQTRSGAPVSGQQNVENKQAVSFLHTPTQTLSHCERHHPAPDPDPPPTTTVDLLVMQQNQSHPPLFINPVGRRGGAKSSASGKTAARRSCQLEHSDNRLHLISGFSSPAGGRLEPLRRTDCRGSRRLPPDLKIKPARWRRPSRGGKPKAKIDKKARKPHPLNP